MSQAILLSDRGVIELSGADATTFLHNLVTNDIASLAPGEARFAALLTPQGKIIADFLVFVREADDGRHLLIDCPRVVAGDLMRRLGLYRLRSKIQIEDRSNEYDNLAFLSAEPVEAETLTRGRDPRAPGLGWRAIAPKGTVEAESDRAPYDAARIAAGVPDGLVDFAYGDAYPHEANMDRLAGVDFKKGCYVGQEVVSRMQHRSGPKKRVTPFRARNAEAPATGTPIVMGEMEIGVAGSHSADAGLALIRLDRLADGRAAGTLAEAAGIALDFPDSAE